MHFVSSEEHAARVLWEAPPDCWDLARFYRDEIQPVEETAELFVRFQKQKSQWWDGQTEGKLVTVRGFRLGSH